MKAIKFYISFFVIIMILIIFREKIMGFRKYIGNFGIFLLKCDK